MTKKIYALCEPGTRTIRYIGQSLNPKVRLTAHICDSRIYETRLARWIRRVVKEGARPELVILHVLSQEESWETEETRYIRAARTLGMDLVNGNDGGEGGVSPTAETLEKMRACKWGDKNPNFGKSPSVETRSKRSAAMIGKRHSEETKELQRQSKKGVKNPNFGRPMPEEQKARVSATLKGRVFTEEHRVNLRKPKPARTPEHCAAISAGIRAKNARKALTT